MGTQYAKVAQALNFEVNSNKLNAQGEHNNRKLKASVTCKAL